MNYTGFWHICMINNWYEVVAEQLVMLLRHGLYDASDEIVVGLVGAECESLKAQVLFAHCPKIKIAYHEEKIDVYEFPTLKVMQDRCRELAAVEPSTVNCQPSTIFYLHTKGVFDPRGTHWRNYMNYYNIERWRDCESKLREGYDTAGVKFMTANSVFPAHYSGNFFHARAEYISRLPDVDSIKDAPNRIHPRHNAEFWHGMGNPRWASLCQVIIDHKRTPEYK